MRKSVLVLSGLAAAFAVLPFAGLPASYEALLYLIFHWTALAVSWNILSGYSGYFSFGHGAFFGIGMYATGYLTTRLGLPFLATLPIAGLLAAAVATLLGAVAFRVHTVRGELFSLLTVAATLVIATIILNTPIDGGSGIYLSGVDAPALAPTASGTFYLLALAVAFVTLLVALVIYHSRFGTGLFAIRDDEDAAEVMGVPTYRLKLAALAIASALAGIVGGVHALFVSYLTTVETFNVLTTLTVVLMAVLGGTRHWAGPAVGAAVITLLLYSFTAGDNAVIGKIVMGALLIGVILFVPQGLLGRFAKRRVVAVRTPPIARSAHESAKQAHGRALGADPDPILLRTSGLSKSFSGIHALRGVDVEVRRGEILGLLGPNGSGKSTFINVVSGHYIATAGSAVLDGQQLCRLPAHRVARSGVARTYQIPRPFAGLTVLENVALTAMFGTARLGRAAAEAQAWEWLAFTGLTQHAQAMPDALNLHQRKFLELARALASGAHLLMLDEVLSGLTPSEIDSAVAMIERIRAEGTTIVFVEHVMRAVHALCDRVVVFDRGEVLASGAPGEVLSRPEVVTAYLGKKEAAPPVADAQPARSEPAAAPAVRPQSTLLELRSIRVAYGAATALWDVSLKLESGGLLCVVGPNSAGKSTLINTIAGLNRLVSGQMLFNGKDMSTVRPHRFCEEGVAVVPESRRLFTKMSVRENLELGAFAAHARAHRQRSLEHVLDLFPILEPRLEQVAGSMSGGQQQMVAIGRALMACPKLLLLDEPSLGLAPSIVLDMFAAIRRIHASGTAVLLVEQNVSMALEIAQQAAVLEEGRIIAFGEASELLQRPEIIKAYLGTASETAEVV